VKKKENLIFRNHIPNLLLKKIKINKSEKIISKTVQNIIENIDKEENIFYSFSKQFKFNFKEKELAKYDRFKNIVIVGMGGSILGSKAIYSFLKHKIKKNFIFLDNLDNDKINKLDKKKNSNKFLFILISKSGNTNET
jgi:glucose-6-phosphate isomerase